MTFLGWLLAVLFGGIAIGARKKSLKPLKKHHHHHWWHHEEKKTRRDRRHA